MMRNAGAWRLGTPARRKSRAADVDARRDETIGNRGVVETNPVAESNAALQPSLVAPTLPFHYFKLAIERLKAAGNLPHRIDRSAWSTKQFRASGFLIVPAFQFLQLIDDEGRPLDALRTLIASFGTETWREQLSATLKVAYSDLLALGIEKATPRDVLELFRQRDGLDAIRARMAVSFFVHATREAGLDIGPFMSATIKPPSPNARMSVDTYRSTMLARLPTFDDNWSEELKLAWFTAFNELTVPRRLP
jgi:hypothetical protein